MSDSNKQQPGNLVELERRIDELDQQFPGLADDIKKKERILILSSLAFGIYTWIVMYYFFELPHVVPFIVAIVAGWGLWSYDRTCLHERLISEPVRGSRRYIRIGIIMSLLVMMSIFIAATKLEPAIDHYLEEQKLEYADKMIKEPEYQRLQQRAEDENRRRKQLRDEIAELENKRIALEEAISVGQIRLDAEAGGITYVHPETGERVGSGKVNNIRNQAANNKWNEINAIQQEHIVTMNSVVSLIDLRKNELAEAEAKTKAISAEKSAMDKKAAAEASNIHNDDAINKMGAFLNMLFQKKSGQEEAWVTLIFLILLSGILEILTWIVLYYPSRRDKGHRIRYEQLASLRNSLLIDKSQQELKNQHPSGNQQSDNRH